MFHICCILFILLSYLIFDFVCLTLSSADTHGIAKHARTYTRDTHTQAHTQKKEKRKSRKIKKIRGGEKKMIIKVGKPQKKKKREGETGKKESRKKRRGEKKKGHSSFHPLQALQ